MKNSRSLNYKARHIRTLGFTLPEVMIASVILAMISGGVMTLFIAVLLFESRTSSAIGASQSAAIAVRRVTVATREAYYLSLPIVSSLGLPDNGCFNTTTNASSGCASENDLSIIAGSGISNSATRFANYNDSSFIAYDSTGAFACQSALFLRLPAANTTAKVNNLSQVAIAAAPSNNSLYSRNTAPSRFLMYFRATSGGVPAPTAGSCLWEIGTDNGASVDKAIVTNIDPHAWNAVEFDRPLLADGSGYINGRG